MRRLEVSTSGKWYLVLTVALGVVALLTANNVLYLAESLLLSGLILSGVLSERAIWNIEVTLLPGEAVAGEPSRDRVRVRNVSRSPFFCVEVGQWRGKQRVRWAYFPRLGPHEERVELSRQLFAARGVWSRDGIYLSTSYPFGFARKIRFLAAPDTRVIWPGPRQAADPRKQQDARSPRRSGAPTPILGEARTFQEGDAWSDVIWKLSARGAGWWVRPRRPEKARSTVALDLALPPGEGFERQVWMAAQPFLADEDACLLVRGRRGQSLIEGRHAGLQYLALVQSEVAPG